MINYRETRFKTIEIYSQTFIENFINTYNALDKLLAKVPSVITLESN